MVEDTNNAKKGVKMGKFKTMQDVVDYVFPESNPKDFHEFVKKKNDELRKSAETNARFHRWWKWRNKR